MSTTSQLSAFQSGTKHELPVAIIGAGPVGLAAAANLALRGEPFVVLERGPEVGHAIRSWGLVRLFSPWRYCIDAQARQLLEATGWVAPDEEALPTGGELVNQYLAPLAAHRAIAPHLRFRAEVTAIGRQGIDKVRTAGREDRPFEIRLADGNHVLARAVIDSSGTWFQPNPMGAGGQPAAGESVSESPSNGIAYGIPDVNGLDRESYAGKRVLVVGSGHSAINSVLSLLQLQEGAPGTRVTWAVRREQLASLFGGEAADALPARGALGTAARAAVESGRLEVLAPFFIHSVEREGAALRVSGELAGTPRSLDVDRVIVATGFRPELEMLRELRLSLDPALESSSNLGPLIDPNLHSCGTVPPHGAKELAHPEPGFFVIGSKSYGRAPTFLMATGYEQARSVVAYLVGDFAAAERVELVLPETGVCSGAPDDEGASCCGTEAAPPVTVARGDIALELVAAQPAAASAGGCCGGPAASDASACCALDEQARADGKSCCGCGDAGAKPLAASGVGAS
jgi:thioredoxin reductase